MGQKRYRVRLALDLVAEAGHWTTATAYKARIAIDHRITTTGGGHECRTLLGPRIPCPHTRRPDSPDDCLPTRDSPPGYYEGDLVVTTTAAFGALTRSGWPMPTLTWERGSEMACHAQFAIDTGIRIFSVDYHSPWQRPSNKSAHGLLRECFLKGLDRATATDHELQGAVDQVNDRPRQRHSFLTPNKVLTAILDNDQEKPVVATTA